MDSCFQCATFQTEKKMVVVFLSATPSQIRTVKVSNLSLGASERDIKEFFSFSGEIEHVEMQRLAFTFEMLLSNVTFFPYLLCSFAGY